MAGLNIFKNMVGVQDLVGIDLGQNTLKIAHVKVAANKKELVYVSARSITGLSDDEVAKAVLVSVRDLKIPKPEFVLFIPSQAVITKNIEVPSVDPKEIREIVNLQAGRHTPYAREEVIVDYISIGTFKQNYTKVLLLIVASNAVKRQFAILDKAAIKIKRSILAQEGVAAFAGKFFKADATIPTALVHIDEASTDFSIIVRNKVLYIRSIPLGKQQLLADKEKALMKIAEEIKKSLEAYQAENIDKNPSLVLLSGALEGIEALDSVLNDALAIPVRVVPYGGVIAKSAQAAEGIAKAPDTSFLGLVAGLFMFSECRTNLIPEEVKMRFALADRGRDLMRTAALAFTAMVLLFFSMVTSVYFKTEFLRTMQEKYKQQQQEARQLQETLAKNSLVKGYLAARGSSVRILAELHTLAPLNLELNFIKFESEGKFIIRGSAESTSTVFSFVESLEKSKYFKDVKPKYTTKRLEGKREFTDFEINTVINKVRE